MHDPTLPEPAVPSPWLPHVIAKSQSLRFGSIHIKIHDGEVVAVESTEQKRFHIAGKERQGQSSAKPFKKTHSTP